jgi:hypothetical protein
MDNSSLGTSFDFNSQAGVMAVLTAIRTSSISSADKNELRDLVFLYTNGGGDPSVRLALEAKIRNLNISPTVPAGVTKEATKEEIKPEPTSVAHPFGTSRPLPVFAAPKVVPNSVPAAPKAAAVAPAPTPLPTEPVTTSVKETPPKEEVVIKPEPVVATPTPAPVAEPVVVKEVPKVEVAKEVNQIPSTDTDTSKYLERIREIKSVVNGKVGNPVNLVDINNEVGREYMNALLDAMKRLSGGAGQIEPAMARLELAFASVLTAIDANERSKTIPKAEPEVQPSAPVEPKVETAPVVQKEVIPPVVKMEVPVMTVEAKPAEPVSGFDAPVVKEPVAEVKLPEAPKVTEVVKPTPVVQTAQSVSDVPRMLTPEDLPSPASLETSETGDPLFTREVDDGLEQLLSDWVLFKKSGLFGTGPKGREHPLFNKIAGLQIPLLLAGRFEGSTQEIKQSITDYMNGWRYEQGIIYEQGETFEHYLRRVIKQILDLQKKRRNT